MALRTYWLGIIEGVRNSWDTTMKLTGLGVFVISNTFCSKTFKKMFSVTITWCCFSFSPCCFFPLLLLTITLKENIFIVTFLCHSESSCIPNTSWKYACFLARHAGAMLLKCRRNEGCVLYQKMRTPKLYVILKKKNIEGINFMQKSTKSISLFNTYDSLKYPPCSLFILYSYPIPIIFDSEFKNLS